MLSGDNGILQRATDAKEKTGIAEVVENAKLDVLAQIAENKGENISKDQLKTILNKYFEGIDTLELPDDLSNSDIKLNANQQNGGYKNIALSEIYNGKFTSEENPPIFQKVADLKAVAISNGVTALSDAGTTTIKDNKDNEIKVPKGFGIATDSGINVSDGIVIEDADNTRQTFGSQFVWVPVGTGINVSTEISASGTVDIPLGRYVFNSSDGTINTSLSKTEPSDPLKTLASANYYYTEELKSTRTINTHAKDIESFISSVKKNKGYYIARYEAGIGGTTSSTTTRTLANGSTLKNSTSSAQIVIKSGIGVWNYINQSNAANVCQNMYNTDNDKVTSDLINSYAWDTAIVFMQNCGHESNSNNYSWERGKSTTGNIASSGVNTLNATSTVDKQCNIYDMAGNLLEWTTELYSGSTSPYVTRGGSYNDTTSNTSARSYNFNNTVKTGGGVHIGFRPILYF